MQRPATPAAPNPAFLNNHVHCFFTRGVVLEGLAQLDHGEDIDVELHPLSAIPSLVADGGIHHALVLAAFAFLWGNPARMAGVSPPRHP